MSYSGAGNRASKNERRDAAREKARAMREQQRKRERRNRWFIQGGIAVVVIAAAVIVSLVLWSSRSTPSAGPVNMQSDGILLAKDAKAVPTPAIPAGGQPVPTTRDKKSSVVSIRIYLDYFCPICNEFETANYDQLTSWMKSGAATVEIHPISFLDRSSEGTRYSSRAANAAGCVATYAPDDYWAWTHEMYLEQPEENSPGLTNAQIIGVMKKAGVHNLSKITTCVNDERYKSWVTDATQRAVDGPLPDSNVKTVAGTPTVIVDGQSFPITDASVSSAAAFATFVEQAASASATTTTPTPTPSPIPTK